MADFFDKMKDGFNKGVATVSTGSKNMLEKSRINSTIKNLEEERYKLAELAGKKVYNYYISNPGMDIPISEVISICQEIDKRNIQIEEQKSRISELEKEMAQVKGTTAADKDGEKCNCGQINPVGAKFCGKCGTPLK